MDNMQNYPNANMPMQNEYADTTMRPMQKDYPETDMKQMPSISQAAVPQTTFPQTTPFPQTTVPQTSMIPTQTMPARTPPVTFPVPGEIPETLGSPIYTAGFLSTQIGKTMRVEFLVGNMMTDRVGTLLAVGASYILLQSIDPSSTIMCDLFSIKFATIVNPQTGHLGSLFPIGSE